ncbi:MAG: MmgE/PrpD family protein [Anaerolineae bacterium]|jgi:2-methylcitrate dehydratase PrpD
MNGNDYVAGFVTGLSWDQLPDGVRDVAHLALLDTLGAALVGTLTPVGRIAAEFAAETWSGETATVLQGNRRASAVGAAFANGCSANGIDMDDCAFYTKSHPGAQIVPTALALSEERRMSGAEMLTGIVVGDEVAHRAALIWHATHDVYQACGS